MTRFALCLGLLLAVAGCKDRTYVFVTVHADRPFDGQITQLRFVSKLMRGEEVVRTDEKRSPEGGGRAPLSFPDSFIILADGRGANGEAIDVFVEGYDASGQVVARGRAVAQVVKDKEAAAQVFLNAPCVQVDDCLAPGAAFCDAPFSCECEGPECAEGFCRPIIIDDANSCTEAVCDEDTRVFTQELVADGTECTTADGAEFTCAQGVCKPPNCGDYIVDVGEECDEGLANSNVNPLACREDCRLPRCGDGVVDVGLAFGAEYDDECDDAGDNSNTEPGACREVELEDGRIACRQAFCSDGVVDPVERCDDGNHANGDGCNPTCTLKGEVSLVAGVPAGGFGYSDGVGEGARLNDHIIGFAVRGGKAYFSSYFPNSTVRSFDPATGEVATVAGSPAEAGDVDGIAEQARFDGPGGITAVGDVLYVADTNNHKIRRVDLSTGVVTTVAGTDQIDEQGFVTSEDGPVTTATLAYPRHVAARSADEILVFEEHEDIGCRLRLLDLGASPPTLTTIGGDAGGASICLYLDEPGEPLFFGHIGGMVMGEEPYLYLTDSGTVRRVDLSQSPVEVDAIAGAPMEFGSSDGTATEARLGEVPGGIVRSGSELYIADPSNDAIRKLSLAGAEVTTLPITPTLVAPRALASVDDSLVVAGFDQPTLELVDLGTMAATTAVGRAEFDCPDADETCFHNLDEIIAIGRRLFVGDLDKVIDIALGDGAMSVLADFATFRVFGLSAHGDELIGLVRTLEGVSLRRVDTSSGTSESIANFGSLGSSVAVMDGYAYVPSLSEAVIRRVDLATGDVVIFAGEPGADEVVDGPLSEAHFGAPAAVAACNGDLYVAESERVPPGFHVIRRIDLGADPPEVKLVAGSVAAPGYRDGPGLLARFDMPAALTCDGQSLYVADHDSHVIRQIVLETNMVSTLVGAPYEPSMNEGTGLDARISSPVGLTIDAAGDLFISSAGEGVIQRVE